MKFWNPIRRSLLILSILVMAAGQSVLASDTEITPYTYTVRLFAGNQDVGVLTGEGVNVVSSGSAAVEYRDDCVEITGLQYDDMVYISAGDAARAVDERYYVKGVRIAGRDTDEEGNAASNFRVDGDRDFVIGYGVSGDMAAYTVNYLDADGNALLESDTYYGNIGERQFVSARYVEGYVPQAYNLVKTLSANTEENVFDFRYRTETVSTATGGGTLTATPGTAGGTGTAGGGAAEGGQTAANAAAPAEGGQTPGDTAGAEAGMDEVEVPEEETPQDLVDLDEEDTPLANRSLDGNERPGTRMSYLPIYIGIGTAAAVTLLMTAIYLKKRRKKPVSPEELLENIRHDE